MEQAQKTIYFYLHSVRFFNITAILYYLFESDRYQVNEHTNRATIFMTQPYQQQSME